MFHFARYASFACCCMSSTICFKVSIACCVPVPGTMHRFLKLSIEQQYILLRIQVVWNVGNTDTRQLLCCKQASQVIMRQCQVRIEYVARPPVVKHIRLQRQSLLVIVGQILPLPALYVRLWFTLCTFLCFAYGLHSAHFYVSFMVYIVHAISIL